MSKAFESIKAGLEEALAYVKNKPAKRYWPEEALRENPIRLDKEKPTKARKRKRKKK